MASFKTMRTLATSLVIGRINYALHVWGNISQVLQSGLQTAILTAARACLSQRHNRDSMVHLLSDMQWQSYPLMVEYNMSKLIHQVLAMGQPASLYSKLAQPAAGATRHSASASLMLPRQRKIKTRRSFAYRGMEACNQLSLKYKTDWLSQNILSQTQTLPPKI